MVSLVTYNGKKYLPFCLESLFNQSYQDWHLFVLDNGSRDETLSVIKNIIQDRANVTVLPPQPTNIGFAAGHNSIIKQADSAYVLLLNQDIIMAPDYLEKLVIFLDGHPRAGAIAGLLLRWEVARGTAQLSERSDNVIDSAGLRVRPRLQVVEQGSGEADRGQYNATEEVFGVSGALPLLRRQALAEAGVFDERFFSYKEDVDLAFRLQHAGWQSFRVGSARAWHERGVGAPVVLGRGETARRRRLKTPRANYLSYRNHWYILIKDVALSDWWRYGIVVLWYEVQKLAYLVMFEQKTLYAWVEIVQALPKLLKKRRIIQPKSLRRWIT